MTTKTSRNNPDQNTIDSFPNLEACCGGTINPESLRRFQIAMHEYDHFMKGLSALLAPAKDNWRDRL